MVATELLSERLEDGGYDAVRVEELLMEALERQDLLDGGLGVSRYSEAGLLTSDNGVVLTTPDGGEWQLTIVRSK